MDTDTLNDAAPRAEWELPPGYVTGEFARVEQALEGDLPHDRLLDLLLFADDREERQHSHREPIDRDWEGLRNKIGAQLLRRMGGDQVAESETSWRNGDVDWALCKIRLAADAIPDSSDTELIELFLQAAENAYLTEGKPMQSRWDAVTRQGRAEILRRISVAQQLEANAPSNVEEAGDGDGVDDNIDTEEFDEDGVACISVREALRDIEDALTRPLSNEALFDLYMLITEVCRHESGKVFEELEPPIIDMMMTRIEAGSPNPEPDGGPTWFDFPERGEEALKALVERQLPHKTLLMLYCLGWYEYDHRDLWLAISDLAKAQILRRMAPPYEAWEGNWEDRARSELLRRLRRHRHDGSTIPSP